MNKDKTTLYQGDFAFRVAGILIHDGRVLLSTDDQVDFWVLPGGGVNLFESSEEALVREFREEIGVTIEIERLLWVVENSFIFDNQKFHGIEFNFLVRLNEMDEILSLDQFTGVEDDFKPSGTRYEDIERLILNFQWFEIDKLDNITIKPAIYHQVLKNIPEHPVLYRNLEIRA